MKRLLFIAALLSWTGSISAQGLVPKPIPCFEPKVYTPASSPGSNPHIEFKSYNCVDIFGPLPAGGPNVIEKGRTEIVAGKYVRFGPGTHIGPLPDPVTPESDPHVFHAYIGENDFEVVWFEPNSTPGYVGQYEKLELGVKLPPLLDSLVRNFVDNVPSTDKINPFNPDSINVEAEFGYNGETYNAYSPEFTKKAYGFYYKEFERVINSTYPHPDSIQTNTWAEDTTSYSFRIRFAPTAIGHWTVKIKIESPVGNYECLPITFECTESGNPGYVKVGTNERYLQLGDQSFIPIGSNLPHPTCYECTGPGKDYAEAYHYEPMKSLGFLKYHDEMEDLSSKGGNYFRMLIAPWSTDIEFEKLNNYSDRLNYGWEVDKIIEKAKELNLYMHLDMQFHYTLEVPSYYDMYSWDWQSNVLEVYDPDTIYFDSTKHSRPDPGYCYQAELGLTTPYEFFTNADAIRHYKNKIRYMISRWGYSTNIGVWELYSEIDNAGAITQKHIIPHPADPTVNYLTTVPNTTASRPYWSNSTETIAISDWQQEMAMYIKQTLDHNQHLVCANYTGGANGVTEGNNSGYWGASVDYDDTYDSPYIDMTVYNLYKGAYLSRFQDLAYTQNPYRFIENEKPIMFSEIGYADKDIDISNCDNNVEFIRTMWCSAFSGAAGPGLDYNSRSHDIYGTWENFGILSDFLYGNTFATEDWEPAHAIRNDDLAEVFALVNSNGEEAIGVIVNRTYNYYTQGEAPCSDGAKTPGGPYDVEQNVIQYFPTTSQHLRLNTMEPGNYVVNYYDALTGSYIQSDNPTVYPIIFDLFLDHPALCLTSPCSEFRPLIAFKAQKIGGLKNLSTSTEDTISNDKKEEIRFDVRPNPANEEVKVWIPDANEKNVLKVLNASGQVVFSSVIGQSLSIDTGNWESGIYLVTLQSNHSYSTKRLVIQHGKN